MPDLMTQHRRQLGLGVQISHQPAVHVDITTGQGKGVYVRRIDYLEMVFEIAAVTIARQLFANFLHVGLQLGIIGHRHLLADLSVGLPPHCQLLTF